MMMPRPTDSRRGKPWTKTAVRCTGKSLCLVRHKNVLVSEEVTRPFLAQCSGTVSFPRRFESGPKLMMSRGPRFDFVLRLR